MKQLALTGLLFFFLNSILFSQTALVTGTIQDENEEPMPFATVALYQLPDSTVLVKAEYSDESGLFEIRNIKPSSYFLSITSVGTQPIQRRVQISEGNNRLGTLTLNTMADELETIVVAASKPLIEVHPDKMVFNVEKSVNAAGSNGWDLLRKSPGIIIDNNDNILMRGRSGVRIFINNRPSRLAAQDLREYLATIPSEQIEAIEMITNPPARYEAEGNAGIINIRLKRNKKFGTNGTVSGSGTYAIYPKYNASLRVDHRNEKASYFSNYSYANGSWRNFMNFYRLQSGNELDIESVFTSDRISHNGRAGADFFLSDKHTLGVAADVNYNENSSWHSNSTIITPAGSTTPTLELLAPNVDVSDRFQYTLNTNYAFQIAKDRSLAFDLNYSYFERDRDLFQPNRYVDINSQQVVTEDNFRNVTPSEIDIYSAQADWESPLGKGKITAGSRFVRVVNDNTLKVYNVGLTEELDNSQSNNFIYTENVAAGYATYSQQLGDVGISVGMRMENTASLGELFVFDSLGMESPEQSNKRNYTDWFPSGGLSWQVSPKHQLGLSYSRRIDRPNYEALNPFEYRINELSLRKGNINLQPQYTHNIQLSHSFNYRLNTTLSYAYTSDFFAQVTLPQPGDDRASFIRTDNIASRKVVSFNMSYPFSLSKWWNVFGNFTLSHSSFNSDDPNAFIALDNTQANFYMQNTFTLPAKFTLELSGWFNTPGVWGGTFRTKSMGSMDIGIQRPFMDKKGQIKVSVSDIFFTQPWRAEYDFAGLIIDGNGGRESRAFTVNLTYNFGNENIKKRRRRSTIDDTQRRLGNG